MANFCGHVPSASRTFASPSHSVSRACNVLCIPCRHATVIFKPAFSVPATYTSQFDSSTIFNVVVGGDFNILGNALASLPLAHVSKSFASALGE